jgi:RimJ/RimL family protein N-acetyltransferase
MDPEDGLDAEASTRDVRIRGSRLLLRALQPGEIEEEWRAMVTADPMAIAELPREAAFGARLQRSGHLEDGWLDLAIDLGGVSIGRIQAFVPPGRALPQGTFELGIELREKARNKGYGREALALLTDWLFEHAAAEVVGASTDPANVAMRTVFQRVGWMAAGSLTEFGREWLTVCTELPAGSGRSGGASACYRGHDGRKPAPIGTAADCPAGPPSRHESAWTETACETVHKAFRGNVTGMAAWARANNRYAVWASGLISAATAG